MIEIKKAGASQAGTIKKIMHEAFEEYNRFDPPSGAMKETEESISHSLTEEREWAAVLYENGSPLGMVRVKEEETRLYFMRLSVVPEARGRGYAKALIDWVETEAENAGKSEVYCKVRCTTEDNIRRYEKLGYEVYHTLTVTRLGTPFDIVAMSKPITM
ncbi:GNAT family N-acetyltransferase [Sinobaca sp. H24]|uniref:GNAT family N-acetyltransferase n=1 Tax=Sinobaca sp. H24 TaxID=2923376 RepID=UPI00207A6BDD|nr:GNAT family N-acetyltransferase [Sinobaca sp. H24]